MSSVFSLFHNPIYCNNFWELFIPLRITSCDWHPWLDVVWTIHVVHSVSVLVFHGKTCLRCFWLCLRYPNLNFRRFWLHLPWLTCPVCGNWFKDLYKGLALSWMFSQLLFVEIFSLSLVGKGKKVYFRNGCFMSHNKKMWEQLQLDLQ